MVMRVACLCSLRPACRPHLSSLGLSLPTTFINTSVGFLAATSECNAATTCQARRRKEEDDKRTSWSVCLFSHLISFLLFLASSCTRSETPTECARTDTPRVYPKTSPLFVTATKGAPLKDLHSYKNPNSQPGINKRHARNVDGERERERNTRQSECFTFERESPIVSVRSHP